MDERLIHVVSNGVEPLFIQLKVLGVDIDDPVSLNAIFMNSYGECDVPRWLYRKSIEDVDGTRKVSVQDLNKIATCIYAIYHMKWSASHKALTPDYNPIQNYNMNESYVGGRNASTSSNITSTNDTTVTQSLRGFNSSVMNPVASSDTSTNATKESLAEGNTVTANDTYTKTREGNIGVTTTQQMITQELELRDRWGYEQMIINDVASYITLRRWDYVF